MPTSTEEKFLRAVLGPAQDLEDTFQNLIINRRVDFAVGESLDILGRLVVEPRNGLDDETYRRRIRARVATNDSDGLINEIINIVRLIMSKDTVVHVYNDVVTGGGNVRVHIIDPNVTGALATVIVKFLNDAVLAGVRVIVTVSQSEPAFRFNTGPGFGGYADPSDGGKLGFGVE